MLCSEFKGFEYGVKEIQILLPVCKLNRKGFILYITGLLFY